MTRKSFVSLAAATMIALGGLSGVAMAEQGMPTQTESESNATWVDASGAGSMPTTTTARDTMGG